MVTCRDVEANRQKVAKLGLTFPVVLQQSWEVSLLYAMFTTPMGYLIDEQGVLASDVAVGAAERILGCIGGAPSWKMRRKIVVTVIGAGTRRGPEGWAAGGPCLACAAPATAKEATKLP